MRKSDVSRDVGYPRVLRGGPPFVSVLVAFALSADFRTSPPTINPPVMGVGVAVGVVALVLILFLGRPPSPLWMCPSCGNAVPDGAVQCPSCGIPIVPPPFR